ncbi:MAG TPA: YicC/YloC family endoribonuclease, partial [Methylomirabilota bacterium]|nr:YicC/YloC family endoribonuclease [Methylomirabilota bacterium]
MRSMTGYGNGSATFPGGRLTVELRTVNHRFMEIK